MLLSSQKKKYLLAVKNSNDAEPCDKGIKVAPTDGNKREQNSFVLLKDSLRNVKSWLSSSSKKGKAAPDRGAQPGTAAEHSHHHSPLVTAMESNEQEALRRRGRTWHVLRDGPAC